MSFLVSHAHNRQRIALLRYRVSHALSLLVSACVFIFASNAFSQAAGGGVANTAHNLGTSGGAGANGQICVFCHTPHGANIGDGTGATIAAPLWNRTFAGSTYQTYDSLGTSSLDGQTTESVGSVSIACLSCHDGTQATNVVINAPGSGGYNVNGAPIPNTTGSAIDAGSVAMLGTDLRNDHPIGIQYAGGGYSTDTPTQSASNLGDPDFELAQTAAIGGQQVWWVDTAGGRAGLRDKTDMALYTRLDTTIGTFAQPFVECGSCHDPHTAEQPTFLRISNASSAVCLACHVK